ncbi:uncharacterized protein EDB91DRAFT_1336823 [Suillus paluster]|uniref:uncharacterized protein n=1 Tax=Suillus paluster TaxID=48578 RepID=UPI001B8784B1|nr:uncharacterized protein EDB91DRAFT_1336823 [Suillus paluster]KAG1739098.1 hypothetical protein EDB91DRAFT_1336823 [Suillus paluster]
MSDLVVTDISSVQGPGSTEQNPTPRNRSGKICRDPTPSVAFNKPRNTFVDQARRSYPSLLLVDYPPHRWTYRKLEFQPSRAEFARIAFELRARKTALCGFYERERMPDAISKTVPVCAQEHDEIEKRLDSGQTILFPKTEITPRLIWILTPNTTIFPKFRESDDDGDAERRFYPVLCIFASKQVLEERCVTGFAYIQGLGNDHELWSMTILSTQTAHKSSRIKIDQTSSSLSLLVCYDGRFEEVGFTITAYSSFAIL